MDQLIESGLIRDEGLKQTDALSPSRRMHALGTLDHWPEYLMEAGEVGLYTMLCAAEVFLRVRGGVIPYCAKLHYANNKRCIFPHAQQIN